MRQKHSLFVLKVERRPDTLWVVKNNKHRGIRIKNPKGERSCSVGFVYMIIFNYKKGL